MVASGIASEWNSIGPHELVSDGEVRLGSGGGRPTADEALDLVG